MGTAPAPSDSTKTTKSGSKTATKASGAGTKTKKPARKKKPSNKASSAAANQATLNNARNATIDLAAQRQNTAARTSDPLWYRVEDVVSIEETRMTESASSKLLPEQIQIVEAALGKNEMSRLDVTPQGFACLLEQSRRYAMELLADSQDYAFVANRQEITHADLQLAMEMRPDHPIAVTTQLPKLNLLANKRNRIPLPPIPTDCYSGILLPPQQHQLTARTFDVVSGVQVKQKMVQPLLSLPTKKPSKASSKPSYGAIKGRQIPIALKEANTTTPAATTSTGNTTTNKAGASSTTPVPTGAGAAVTSAATPTPSSGDTPTPMEVSSPAATTSPAPAVNIPPATNTAAGSSTGSTGAGTAPPTSGGAGSGAGAP